MLHVLGADLIFKICDVVVIKPHSFPPQRAPEL